MHCKGCGKEVEEGAKFCRACGAAIVSSKQQFQVHQTVKYQQQQPASVKASKGWFRLKEGKILGGVCAGLSNRFGVALTPLRIIAVIGVFITGSIVLWTYLVLWLLLPLRSMNYPQGINTQ